MPLNSFLILTVIELNRKKVKKRLNFYQLSSARNDHKFYNE